MALWRELRRRHIFRIAAAYVVTAWLLMQLGAILFPAFGAPHWAIRLLFGFLVLGFPVALLLAWAFEVTPEGVRRTRAANDSGEQTPATRRRVGRTLNVAIIVVLAAAVGILAWQRFGTVGEHSAQPAAATAAAAPSGGTATNAAASATAIPAKSIAVLPFENLSPDKNNAYFAAGMQDLILTKLADVGELKVISRTSTERFDSHPDDLEKIGRELGVATILEGSVQKAGKQVLINVQLIDARTDSHIWAKSYTRTLHNVFGVEGEVAQKIADSLQAKLTEPEQHQLAVAPTTNAAAYDAYLHARAVSSTSTAYNREAAASYRRAVTLDPGFGLAWAGLAYAEANMYANHVGDRDQELASARHALDKARALAPDAAQTLLALGNFRMVTRQDFGGALASCEKAAARAPGDPNVLWCVTRAKWALGQRQQVLALARKAIALDPLNPGTLNVEGNYFYETRHLSAALKLVNRTLALSPQDVDAIEGKAGIYLAEGRLKDAGKVLARARASISGSPARGLTFITWRVKFVSRDYAGATALLRPLLKPSSPINLDYRAVLWDFLGMALQRAGKAQAAHDAFAHALAGAHRLLARKDKSDRESRADYHIILGWAEAGLGHRQAALDAANKAVALVPASLDAARPPDLEALRAWIEAWLGDRAAIAALPRLLRIASPDLVSVPLLKLDPIWDPLRKDPRFQVLLKQYQATPASTATAATPTP